MTTEQAVKLAETVEMLMEVKAQYIAEAAAKNGNEPLSATQAPLAATAVPKREPARLLYDPKESATLLSMSVHTIRKLIRQRLLRPVPDIRKILISENELQRLSGQM